MHAFIRVRSNEIYIYLQVIKVEWVLLKYIAHTKLQTGATPFPMKRTFVKVSEICEHLQKLHCYKYSNEFSSLYENVQKMSMFARAIRMLIYRNMQVYISLKFYCYM